MSENIYLASQQWVIDNVATSVTYDELTGLTSTSGLTIGGKYLITDYQTVHTIPNTSDINTGTTESLLVTASGTNTLKPEAYSYLYPQDVIYYDWNNRQDMVSGCTKGYISRRIDTINHNDIPLDFRNVIFRRWQIDVTNIWNSGTTYNNNTVVLNSGSTEIYVCLRNYVTSNLDNTNDWFSLNIHNLDYVSPIGVSLDLSNNLIPCSTNYFDYNMFTIYDETICCNTITYNSIYNLDIINNCNSVIFGDNFNYNTIGDNFSNNNIGSDFQNNTFLKGIGYTNIGNFCSSNYVIDCYQNCIGDYFSSNSIASGFQLNKIADDFILNTIQSAFNENHINIDFGSNNIASYFSSNIIGLHCSENVINDGFFGNTIIQNFTMNIVYANFNNHSQTNGLDFTLATHVYLPYTCELYIRPDLTKRLRYYGDDDLVHVVAADA